MYEDCKTTGQMKNMLKNKLDMDRDEAVHNICIDLAQAYRESKQYFDISRRLQERENGGEIRAMKEEYELKLDTEYIKIRRLEAYQKDLEAYNSNLKISARDLKEALDVEVSFKLNQKEEIKILKRELEIANNNQ